MRDVLGMLQIADDRLDDLVENGHEERDIGAELTTLRRMVRGCMAVVANDLGIILHPTDQHLIQKDFPEVPR